MDEAHYTETWHIMSPATGLRIGAAWECLRCQAYGMSADIRAARGAAEQHERTAG